MAETVQPSDAFEEWIGQFTAWQDRIGFPRHLLGDFEFTIKFGGLEHDEIEYGEWKGRPKFTSPEEIPNERVRDLLLKLIVVQGDTEFASVEQQRHLLKEAPSHYDKMSALRVMAEEQRHGWQMCHLLIDHFGERGMEEAEKQLERSADEGDRLLGSFNEPVDNWLDFFTFTQFIDRDGKYQLTMLSTSGFKPLARSMGPMLVEESFHLGTGMNGLKRVIEAGRIPLDVLQRNFNKWVPTAYDLFGKDGSDFAHYAYVYGLKGRYDEPERDDAPDTRKLNSMARGHFHDEVSRQVELLNRAIPAAYPDANGGLYVPDMRFHREIGEHAGERYSVHGEPLSETEYEDHLAEVLPTEEDREVLEECFKDEDWIAPKHARWPEETFGEDAAQAS